VPYELPDAQFLAMMSLHNAAKRYGYCIKKLADTQKLYLLKGPDGPCMIAAGEDNLAQLPLWPHPRFAEAYLTNVPIAATEWPRCTIRELDLHEFMTCDLQDMILKGLEIAAFPIPPGKAIVIAAQEFHEHLRFELAKYE
jgi:hypothetical protein